MTTSLIELSGSPFNKQPLKPYTEAQLLAIYEQAFKDRVALLYLTQYRQAGWCAELEAKFQALDERRQMTNSVIAAVAKTLNQLAPDNYLVFKSLKPFPGTPNDTDIIFLGDAEAYEAAYEHLLSNGYHFHEWAPQQRTVYDPRGAGKIGKGKKGGTYYIDLYQEVSTDYFAYLNKQHLRKYKIIKEIEGVAVPMLRPEPEIAIVLFHNVFPERTFQLEHFYLPLYYFLDPDFDLDLFVQFSEENHLQPAVCANLSLVAALHMRYFGFVPAPVQYVLDRWKVNRREQKRFMQMGQETPYLFSPLLFWRSFITKLAEWYSLKTALYQVWQLRDPHFLREVVHSIQMRLGQESIYKLE